MAENLKHSSNLRNGFRSPAVRLSMLLVGLTIISGLTGCRTGMFSNRETIFPKPNLGKMAFWKKDSAMPSPPAMHFQPAPAAGEQLATTEQNQPFRNTEQELQQSLEAMATATNEGFDRATEELSAMADSLRDNPIRTPFTLSSDPQIERRTNESDFVGSRDFKPNSPTNPINTLAAVAAFNPSGSQTSGGPSEFTPDQVARSPASQPDQSLARAREDFATAMNNTVTTWNNATTATRENLDSLKNNLRDEAQQQVNQNYASAQREIEQFRNQLATTKQQMLAPLASPQSASLSTANGFDTQPDTALFSPSNNQFDPRTSVTNSSLAPKTHQSNLTPVTLNAHPEARASAASQTVATIGPLDNSPPENSFQPPGGNGRTATERAEGYQQATASTPYPSTGYAEIKPNQLDSRSPLAPSSVASAPASSDNVRLAGLDGTGGNFSPASNPPNFSPFTPLESGNSNFSNSSSPPPATRSLDVMIPESVLNIQGGYTPGSLNRVLLR